jgi:hypothetical protein
MSPVLVERSTLQTELPEAMQQAPRWLVWRAEGASGKPRKVPYYADGSRRQGRLDTTADWSRLATFDLALTAMESGTYSGLGFALGPDGSGHSWKGIDLDHVADHPGLGVIAEMLPGYVERSPSGTGLHAIGYGLAFKALGSNTTGIEAYSGGRYFTVTGEAIGGDIEDISQFVSERLAPLHAPPVKTKRHAPDSVANTHDLTAVQIDEVRSAIFHLHADDRDVWIKMGMALKTLGDTGRGIWLAWSATSEKFDPQDAVRVWDSFRGEGVTIKTVFAEASRAGWINPRANVVRIKPQVSAQPAPDPVPTVDDWQANLIVKVSKNGTEHIPCRVHNLILILRHATEFAGRIRYNAFSGQVALDGRDMDDVGPILMKAAVEKNWIDQEKVSTSEMIEALSAVAHTSPFHPVRDWLESLTWDGTPRIGSFCSTYLGRPDDDYHRAVMNALFMSAVLRIYKPGCKVDTMTILQGVQGIGKTKLWAALFNPWYAEVVDSLNTKDFFIGLSGVWCADFGELDQFSKAESTRIKQVLSSQADNYRGLWKGNHQKHPRQSIFVGGTNQDRFNNDATGARRFLPIVVNQAIDVDAVAKVRDQLFAEAVFNAKVDPGRWWDIPNASDHQEEIYIGDPWEDPVHQHLRDLDIAVKSNQYGAAYETTTAYVLYNVLKIDTGKHTRSDDMRVSAILKRAGWERKRRGKSWFYCATQRWIEERRE